MAQQIFPVTLIAIPAPVGIEAFNFNQLTQLLAQYLSATVSADVTFFQQGATLPTTDQGVVFYSTATGLFYFWNTSLGAYYPTGLNIPLGSTMFCYTNADLLSQGYVLASGSRVIDAITSLSANQATNLHLLFGAGATVQVPNVTAPTSTVGGGGGSGGTLYPFIFCGF